MITGAVKGSAGQNYRQYIEIESSNGIFEIEGRCSCPVQYNCKHVVAICIQYAVLAENYKSNEPQQSPLEQWLENLEASKSIDNKDKDYFLTYRLFSTGSYHKDELLFYKSKILKNGSISQGTNIDSYRVVTGHHDELLNSTDKEIVQFSKIMYTETRYKRGQSKITGKLGYVLIQELLKTNLCFFDDTKKPLTFSNDKFKSKFHFSLYKGMYTLKSNINNKLYKLIETTPPLVIDIENNIIQELNTDLETYTKLTTAPKIEKSDIVKVISSIGNNIEHIDLETPKSIKVNKIESKPKPQLKLSYIDNNEIKNISTMKIEFNYDNHIVSYIPREDIKVIYQNDGKLEIIRDLDFEDKIKTKIESFGFEIEIIKNNLIVALKEENKQAQLKVWKEFLNVHIDTLKQDGWIINIDTSFKMKFEQESNISVISEDTSDWFNLSFNLEFDGVSQPIAPLVSGIINEFDTMKDIPDTVNIEVEKNHFVEVKTSHIQPIIQTIFELNEKKQKDDSLKVSPFDAHLIANLDEDIKWQGSKEILELSKKLKEFKGLEKVTPPSCLNATLRDYQQDGINWLNFLYEFKFGGILADDMGLGKTIQTLTHLSRLKEDDKLTLPSLIVMPTSLIANWKNEAAKFTPNLSVLSLHGQDRASRFQDIKNYDILLTTYPLIVRDKEKFDKEKFLYIILDEAQKIKNPKTKMTMSIKTFKSEHRLALSGTPIENHLGELWSIFSFLMPGFLDTQSFFKNYYQTPIENENDMNRQQLLNKRVKPFMIRRTKEIVAHELPAKSEIIKYTQFDTKQAKLYESIRVTMEKKVQDAVKNKGLGSSHITILDALLKLRQVCCDPSLLKIDEAKKVQESAKLELFLDLIDELLAENRKILVFSQFTSMLKIIEEKIIDKKVSYTKLTGSTKNREEVIDKFTNGEADIFLISLKAGGVGLNLTQADTVIHYDPWWNPAVENQATDRAYRIGQTKPVFVYKLIVENTIEQKILDLQKKKQALQDGIYDENKQQKDVKFNGNELMDLLKSNL